jgi:hypothetical protein
MGARDGKTRGRGDKEIGRMGTRDGETMRQGDVETRGRGDKGIVPEEGDTVTARQGE